MYKLAEALAYGIARGAIRAWYDIQEARSKADEERITDTDRARADRFRDAVHGVLEEEAGDSG